jgi:hypothetical protein
MAGPPALPAVRDWLLVRGDQPRPLLNPVLKGGRRQQWRFEPRPATTSARHTEDWG